MDEKKETRYVIVVYNRYKTLRDFLYIDSIWDDHERAIHYLQKRQEHKQEAENSPVTLEFELCALDTILTKKEEGTKFLLNKASDHYNAEEVYISSLEDLEAIEKQQIKKIEEYNNKLDLYNEQVRNYDGLIIKFNEKQITVYDDVIE